MTSTTPDWAQLRLSGCDISLGHCERAKEIPTYQGGLVQPGELPGEEPGLPYGMVPMGLEERCLQRSEEPPPPTPGPGRPAVGSKARDRMTEARPTTPS